MHTLDNAPGPSGPVVPDTDDAADNAKPTRGAGTAEAILRSALRLMSENGYNGVSLRRICMDANVNLALMNYHFGTKGQLLLAIFQRTGGKINADMLHGLEALEARYPDRTPPLEELLDAFLRATLRLTSAHNEDDLYFLRLAGRIATDPTPDVRKVVNAVYNEGAVRFVRLLREACPHLSTAEFFMRLVFLYGALVYTRADVGRVDALAEQMNIELPPLSMEQACQYMVPFLAAAFRAASSDLRPED